MAPPSIRPVATLPSARFARQPERSFGAQVVARHAPSAIRRAHIDTSATILTGVLAAATASLGLMYSQNWTNSRDAPLRGTVTF
jgi:hypothetical protein